MMPLYIKPFVFMGLFEQVYVWSWEKGFSDLPEVCYSVFSSSIQMQ